MQSNLYIHIAISEIFCFRPQLCLSMTFCNQPDTRHFGMQQDKFMPYFLDAGFEVHAVSLRGQGQSGVGPGQKAGGSLRSHAEDIAEVISSLDREPVMISHSLGGLVAQRCPLVISTHRQLLPGMHLHSSTNISTSSKQSRSMHWYHLFQHRELFKLSQQVAKQCSGTREFTAAASIPQLQQPASLLSRMCIMESFWQPHLSCPSCNFYGTAMPQQTGNQQEPAILSNGVVIAHLLH